MENDGGVMRHDGDHDDNDATVTTNECDSNTETLLLTHRVESPFV